MPMDSGEPIPMEMFKGDPIPLYSQDEVEHEHNGDKIEEDQKEK